MTSSLLSSVMAAGGFVSVPLTTTRSGPFRTHDHRCRSSPRRLFATATSPQPNNPEDGPRQEGKFGGRELHMRPYLSRFLNPTLTRPTLDVEAVCNLAPDKCSLVVVGIYMESVPAVVRERLAFPDTEYSVVTNQLLGLPSVKEAIVLRSLNIFQVYAVVQPTSLAVQELVAWIVQRTRFSDSELKQNLFVHRNGKAARFLFETSCKTSITSLIFNSLMMGSISGGGIGSILQDLTTTAYSIGDNHLYANGSISVAALSVAREAMLQLRTPRILIVGANSISHLLINELLGLYKVEYKNLTVVCDDHDLEGHINNPLLEVGIPSKPMSQLLPSISDANIIFITSPCSHSGPFLLSTIDINTLPPPVNEEMKIGGQSQPCRVFVDMCFPSTVEFSEATPKYKIFTMNDLLEAVGRRESEFGYQIEKYVKEFELRMEGALEEGGVYGERTRNAPMGHTVEWEAPIIMRVPFSLTPKCV